MGTDIIHSVLNPIDRFTGAIHIYGGDFFRVNGVYTTIDPAGTVGTLPFGMNASGQVVGEYWATNTDHGFFASPDATSSAPTFNFATLDDPQWFRVQLGASEISEPEKSRRDMVRPWKAPALDASPA